MSKRWQSGTQPVVVLSLVWCVFTTSSHRRVNFTVHVHRISVDELIYATCFTAFPCLANMSLAVCLQVSRLKHLTIDIGQEVRSFSGLVSANVPKYRLRFVIKITMKLCVDQAN